MGELGRLRLPNTPYFLTHPAVFQKTFDSWFYYPNQNDIINLQFC